MRNLLIQMRKQYDNLVKNKFRGEIEMNKLQLNSKKIIIWLCVNYGIFILAFLVLEYYPTFPEK